MNIVKSQTVKKKTQPPKPYTEATLLSAMENAGREVEDETIKEQLKESGIGTPATRAAIIERLLSVRIYKENRQNTYTRRKRHKTVYDCARRA